MRKLLLFFFFLATTHCSSPAADDAPKTASLHAVPAGECSPGTMPAVAEAGCVAVGTGACVDGFETRDDGWGCRAIRPAAACTGADRAAIGAAACVAVDDCSAAFPPAGAHAVVRDSAALAAALASAPVDAVIALDEGAYDTIEITKPVSLVGRCAAKVTVANTALRGILVDGKVRASVQGVTISGQKGAVVVSNGADATFSKIVMKDNAYGIVAAAAKLTVSDSLVEGGANGRGLLGALSDAGAELVLSNVEIRDYLTGVRAKDRGVATVRRSILSNAGPSTSTQALVGAYAEGRVVVEESGVYAKRASSTISIVGRTLPPATKEKNPNPGTVRFVSSELSKADFEDDGWIFGTHEGGRVELEGTTVVHRAGVAFDVRDAETTVSMKRSVIVSVSQKKVAHDAINVFSGAHAELEAVALVAPSSVAGFVGDVGSELSFVRSLVTGLRSGEPAAALVADRMSSLKVDGSSFVDGEGWAILGYAGSKLQVNRTLVDGFESGVILGAECTLAMSESLLRNNHDAALTAVISTAIVKDTVFEGNAHVLHLDGSILVETTNESAVAGPREVLFSRNALSDNGPLVRTGHVEIPGYVAED